MKKIYYGVFILLSVFLVSLAFAGQGSEKITEKDIKKCMAKKKRDAIIRGFILTDSVSLRVTCLKELKGDWL